MDDELTIGAAITLVGGGLLEVMRRWTKSSVAARVAAARADADAKHQLAETVRQIGERAAADAGRAISALIDHARDAQRMLSAADALRASVEESTENQRRELAALSGEVRELAKRVDSVTEMMMRYDEFRKNPIYRR